MSSRSLNHSYFAIMGGFEVVMEDNKLIFPSKLNSLSKASLTLCPSRLTLIAKQDPGLISDIPVRQIHDKSNGRLPR
jgi:hypothetical protein